MSAPLTTASVLNLRGKTVFARWFFPEREGSPDTAWLSRWEGPVFIEVIERTGRLRRGSGRQLIHIHGARLEIFTETHRKLAEGHEFDGQGFAFLFLSEADANAWVAGQRARLVRETAALAEAVNRSIGIVRFA